MKFGASMFFTDYSMGAAELAVALEQRGFDIVWAPEHSHIPLSRKTAPAGGGGSAHSYTLEEFGLTGEEVDDRFGPDPA